VRRAFLNWSCAVLVAASTAFAGDAVEAGPLDHLAAEISEQDKLVADGKVDQVVAVARGFAKDGSADHHFLVGRALVAKAQRAIEGKDAAAPSSVLDEAGEAFGRATEAGGVTYAPAHLGFAQVAMLRYVLAGRGLVDVPEKERVARIEEVLRELDPAIDHLRKALALSKDFREAALELAQVLRLKGQETESMAILAKYLADHPKDATVRLYLGHLKMTRRQFAEAEPEFRAALAADESNADARRFLAMSLMAQDLLDEASKHWELLRAANPKDQDCYEALLECYVRLQKQPEARKVLEDLVRAFPGTTAASRARARLEALDKDPAALERMVAVTPEQLVKRLDSKDPAEVLGALEKMREYQWRNALPGRVYELLCRDKATPAQRLAAVRLIGDHGDPMTLTILEIMLLHPTDRETDAPTRKEVAHAISRLPSDAIVPILYEALGDADPDVREWAVQGLATRTGKWFRNDLAARTAEKDWPAELELYRRWWATTSSSAAKRSAMTALLEIYGPTERNKTRIAHYALCAMDDAIESTWRAGYDLFRTLSRKSFGAEQGSVEAPERARIAREARAWLDQELSRK
jgi:tetratricopeptide (TPR) repeat protein